MPIVAHIFAEEINSGINIFSGGRDQVDVVAIQPNETKVLNYVFDLGQNALRKLSAKIAADIEPQRSLVHKFAGVVKASISTTGGTKPLTFPSTPGSLGVSWVTPEMIRYISTRSTTNSAYTDYPTDSWTITTTAGTPTFILGSGTYTANTPPTTAPTLSTTNYFQGSQQSQAHSMYLFFQHGLVEVGTTPKMQQFQIYTSALQKYGIWAANPVNEISMEDDKWIYQYPTLGAVPVYFDLGITWAGMPITTGTSVVKPLGLCYYEHSFAPTLVYV